MTKRLFKDERQDLVSQWSPVNTVNIVTISPMSNVKALWICDKGHEWEALVASRSRGSGCPYCAGQKVWRGFNDLATTHPGLAREWSPRNALSPEEVTSGSSRKIWWVGKCGHEWEAVVAQRSLANQGCPYCTGRKVLTGFNDLATTHPELAREWSSRNILSANQVGAGSSIKAWWTCSEGHEWEAMPNSRSRKGGKGTGCPYCSGFRVLAGFNDLATTHPELAREWSERNKTAPSTVSKGYCNKVLWECSLGHEWEATPNARTNQNQGCPYCSGHRVLAGFNDLATTHPELASEVSDSIYSAEDLNFGSNKKITWKCVLGHTWVASPNSRTNSKTGCPICSGNRVLEGFNDLATTHPELVEEWSTSNSLKPADISCGSNYRAVWICAEGHEWFSTVKDRSFGYGCPICAKAVSGAERTLVEYIEELSIEVTPSSRQIIPPFELDLYLEDKKFAIEYNGLIWHSERFGKDKNYHANKTRMCAEKGIQLIHIWEDEWLRNPDLVKRMLARKLGVSEEKKVFARKTTVVSVSKEDARAFLSEHHIQGYAAGTHYLGLTSNEGEVVAVMVLKKLKGDLRLDRYATSCIVPGGFTKLVSWVQKNLEFEKLVTFADLCVSDGSLYENTGWTRDGMLDPDYRYLVGSERVHKFNYRLKRFREDPDLLYEEGMTERELAALNGLERIWDCGKIRYVLEKERHETTKTD